MPTTPSGLTLRPMAVPTSSGTTSLSSFLATLLVLSTATTGSRSFLLAAADDDARAADPTWAAASLTSVLPTALCATWTAEGRALLPLLLANQRYVTPARRRMMTTASAARTAAISSPPDSTDDGVGDAPVPAAEGESRGVDEDDEGVGRA